MQTPPSSDPSPLNSVLFPIAQFVFDKSLAGARTATPRLLVWSAADKDGLARIAKIYSTYFSQASLILNPGMEDAFLDNLAFTLASRRSSLAYKSITVASSISELTKLESKMTLPTRSQPLPILGYIFTGQGAQYAEMGKGLSQFPAFQASLDRSEAYLSSLGCLWSLKGLILGSFLTPFNRRILLHV